jgi:hypothetical protein
MDGTVEILLYKSYKSSIDIISLYPTWRMKSISCGHVLLIYLANYLWKPAAQICADACGTEIGLGYVGILV